MKPIEEMHINELTEFVAGDLQIAIGKGSFKETVWKWITHLQITNYNRGFKDGQRAKKPKKVRQ